VHKWHGQLTFADGRSAALSTTDGKVSFTNSSESHAKPSTSKTPLAAASADLIKLARAALQERRISECLTLTGAILKMDPSNHEAEVLQSWIRADLAEQYAAACERANEARARGDRAKWGAVRTSLRRLLNVMPDHDGVRALLMEAESALSSPFEPIARAASVPPRPVKPHNRFRGPFVIGAMILLVAAAFAYWTFGPLRSSPAELPGFASNNENYGTLYLELEDGIQVFVDGKDLGTTPLQPLRLPAGRHRVTYRSAGVAVDEEDVDIVNDQKATNKAGKTLGRLDLVVVPESGVELKVNGERIGPAPQFMFLKPGLHELSLTAEGYESHIGKVLVVAGQRSLVPVLLQQAPPAERPVQEAAPAAAKNTRDITARVVVDSKPAVARPAPNPPPTGKLAVTSSRRVQIYSGERYLGSSPAVLEFPPGLQTLEYRYASGRQQITHMVRSNETTQVSIATDIVVKINAQPWAEVFVQDDQISSLGHTPLNNVRVPVGALLLFKNPRFADKTYRVMQNDTTIAVTLP
jgi:hypothetical protein